MIRDPEPEPQRDEHPIVLRIEGNYTLEELQRDLEFFLPTPTCGNTQYHLGKLTKKAVQCRLWYIQLVYDSRERDDRLKVLHERKAYLDRKVTRVNRSAGHVNELQAVEQEIVSVQRQRTVYVSMAYKAREAYKHITGWMESVGNPILWPEPKPGDARKFPEPLTGQWLHLMNTKYEWRD